MNTWIITDTHFGHTKLTENNFRPEGFEDKIMDNMSRLIKEGDIIVHLGDFCIRDDEEWNYAYLSTFKNMNNLLIKGNHDNKSNTWYYNHGWNFVCESFTDIIFGKKVTFSHIPITNIDHINIHGHTHGNAHRDSDFIANPNHIEIALELNGYMPVSLKKILA